MRGNPAAAVLSVLAVPGDPERTFVVVGLTTCAHGPRVGLETPIIPVEFAFDDPRDDHERDLV